MSIGLPSSHSYEYTHRYMPPNISCQGMLNDNVDRNKGFRLALGEVRQ